MKVAIVGAGIVGSTAAYYLSKKSDVDLTVFDAGQGQATKAAAGIISPWFSKRRNKAWYRLARLGADFYQDLISDLTAEQITTDFYQQTGVYLLKKEEVKLEELYQLALSRREESPLIGELAILDKGQVSKRFPGLEGFDHLLYASGGARVEGSLLTETLLKASQVQVHSELVSLEREGSGYQIAGQHFDCVILATGAWLGQLLTPLGYQVDVRPQKGQLRDYQFELVTDDYPVVMPEGEFDLIPFRNGKISMGATHENDMGFDLTVDHALLQRMEEEACSYYPELARAEVLGERVGTRAYTSDFSPFWGAVPDQSGLYVASGLGSSGLTTGPLIGWHLAQLVAGGDLLLDPADYPVERYIHLRDSHLI
ncbi:NAD(P)/FAD-dependent oxidoreductase [Streptococcus sp. DD13]|uniref:NAD(P)/FAD-dependent oxidoreductase n=1 Tax=Streptococcus sp. DD13 TaxID=1777881 RepID=UPI0007952332|nr:FAD-dependent oxidoreductase [Streptococcus sp. DD13]KXT79135.1 Glycine/D-amino acid oxidases family [Streptococcus sp. DD13]